jgi:hypothetical protein
MLMFAPAQKNFSPAPAQHDHVHVLVEARLENGVVEVAHHLVRVGVRGRIGQLDPADAVLDAVVDELRLGGFHGRGLPMEVRSKEQRARARGAVIGLNDAV